MNQSFASTFDQIVKTLTTFNKEELDLWELQVSEQQMKNIGKPCSFSTYFEDIKGFPKSPAVFSMTFPDCEMNLSNICFEQDATEGVDIILNRDEISSKLGPDSIPAGHTDRPKPVEQKHNKDGKKKKKNKKHDHKKGHHNSGIAKSKSVAVMSDL